ncbi:MAG: bifunctional 4-hydroxy-2-oxoglutarate aldolase/2-dehydro-3-deoxy-phosphogluconate aldolase [Terricaulis sp.]
MSLDAESVLKLTPVMPVVVIDDPAHAEPLARALLAAGVKTAEITLRTAYAAEAIQIIAHKVPELIVGAGTVLTEDDLNIAMVAGAKYALSPGGTRKLLKAARKAQIAFIPGVATASEVMEGLALGYHCFKFFPAEQMGGAAAVKALHGPLPAARFCPTGSITPEKVASYLALDNVLCVGGSWITPADKMKAGDWAGITELARKAASFAK